MPIQRNQPSPERQSVLSFVSPSVADLLFYETVDAKTVGAGSGRAITNATWANNVSVNVAAGDHNAGHTVTITTDGDHLLVNGDYVTVEGLGRDSGYFSANGTHKIANASGDSFTYFVREQPDASSPIDVTDNPRVYLAHPSYGTAHPDTENFPRHKLCHVKQADPNGLFYQYYYAASRESQDDYNFEFSQADLGGNRYDTVVRTYVNLRSEFKDTHTEYQAGDPMPDVPAAQFEDSYILMTREQKRIGDAELDGVFIVEQRVYFKYEDRVSYRSDPEFGDSLKTTEILAYVGKSSVPNKQNESGVTWAKSVGETDANWGVTDGGINYEVSRLSNDWWQVIVQDIVPDTLAGGGVTYTTTRNYSYPAELVGFRFTPIARKDGSSETSVTALKKDAFSGPIQVQVNRKWSATAPSDTYTPTFFKPTGGSYSGALFNLSYSNVLCAPFTLIDTVGTTHPVYKPGAYANQFFEDGTTPQAQPASGSTVNMGRIVKPFRGGYLIETLTGTIP